MGDLEDFNFYDCFGSQPLQRPVSLKSIGQQSLYVNMSSQPLDKPSKNFSICTSMVS